jgi:3',5'-cyclic AMP phosphodiesterase CpdA
MTVLVQLSDFHVGSDEGGDPVSDLRSAVAAVRAMRPGPDAVLVSGDLVEHGSPDEYAIVREALGPLAMPVHVLPGNHDDREALRAAFATAQPAATTPVTGRAPYRYATRVGALALVACDSTRPGRPDGALDDDSLEWLAQALTVASPGPAIVAMHHPPITIGMPVLDAMGIQARDRGALATLLASFPNVVRVVAGHVHMATFGRLGSHQVSTCPSTWRHGPALEIGATDLTMRSAPAGLLVHALGDGGLVTHVQPL